GRVPEFAKGGEHVCTGIYRIHGWIGLMLERLALVKCQPFAHLFLVELSIVERMMPCNKNVLHGRPERRPRKRRPAALGEDVFLAHNPVLIQNHANEIGIVTFSNKAAILHVENQRRIVTHFLNDFFQRNLSLVIKLQRSDETMLNQWPTRRTLEICVLLFLQGVWGVIGGDDIKAVV